MCECIDVSMYQVEIAGVFPSASFFFPKVLRLPRTENVWPRADPGYVDWLGEARIGETQRFFFPMGRNKM